MNKLRILLADDHQTIRDGLKLLVNSQSDMETVGEADNGRVAVQLAQELLPDVVVMDVSMPELNGLQATKKLNQKCPQVKVLTLTRHTDDGYLQSDSRATLLPLRLLRTVRASFPAHGSSLSNALLIERASYHH